MNDPAAQTMRDVLEQELARESTSREHLEEIRTYRNLLQWWADRQRFAENKEFQNGYGNGVTYE